MNEGAPVLDLPVDLLGHMLGFLEPKDVVSCLSVSKRWRFLPDTPGRSIYRLLALRTDWKCLSPDYVRRGAASVGRCAVDATGDQFFPTWRSFFLHLHREELKRWKFNRHTRHARRIHEWKQRFADGSVPTTVPRPARHAPGSFTQRAAAARWVVPVLTLGRDGVRDVRFVTRLHCVGYAGYALPLLTWWWGARAAALGTFAGCLLRGLTYQSYFDERCEEPTALRERLRAVLSCARFGTLVSACLLLLRRIVRHFVARVRRAWSGEKLATSSRSSSSSSRSRSRSSSGGYGDDSMFDLVLDAWADSSDDRRSGVSLPDLVGGLVRAALPATSISLGGALRVPGFFL